jgi:NAD(P)H dehydrogenase (quinone)
MKALIVIAHPEPKSLNGHLARFAFDTLSKRGHQVRISDLYAAGFEPSEAGRHFEVRQDANCFDVQSEQRFNWERGSLPADVKEQIEKIFWADLLVLQFPLWWFGLPAILKGWMDRVFVYGGLYSSSRTHDCGPCRGKNAIMCVTAGSSQSACTYNGSEGDTKLMLWPSLFALRYVGFSVLQPFIIYGASRHSNGVDKSSNGEWFRNSEQEYARCLLNIHDWPIVPFNSPNDWDENGKLKPNAPAYSPFIRHREVLELK